MNFFNKTKPYRRRVFICVGIIIFVVAFLEIGSRIIRCDDSEGVICNPGIYNIMAPVEQVSPEIIAIREKRAAGVVVTSQEYIAAFEKLVIEVDPSTMPIVANGYACGDSAYVRNDLPGEAMLYVKRHELEHLINSQESEFQVNVIAFKEYPLGGIETILFTLKNFLILSLQKPCAIFGLWGSFKIYFLPF